MRLLLGALLTLFLSHAAGADVTVVGSVAGDDGRPLSEGKVQLFLPAAGDPSATVDVDARGTFTLRTSRAGLAYAHVSGRDHARRAVALFLRQERIQLDVQLAKTPQQARVTFHPPNGFDARFARVHEDMLARRERVAAARRTHAAAGRPAHTFRFDWSADLRTLAGAIDSEKHPTLRKALLISYLDLGLAADGARIRSAMAEKAFATIEATSTLWSVEPYLLRIALRAARSETPHAAYVRKVIADHPDRWTRTVAEKTASPSRRIMPGKPVPTFRVTSYDDANVAYSPESLRGKVYLIDFWATYCAPCLEELPNMNAVYAKYRPRGFEIVSLSIDDERETVTKFRAGHQMPWLNAILLGGAKNALLKEFEIIGIPRAILVDRRGTIVATDSDLRGPNLERTVARIMGGR